MSERALPLVIEVLDGPLKNRVLQAGKPRGQIHLEGRSLPYRPMTFEGHQRVKTTWYAGNTSGTQQVMGPVEDPTTINGTWKDRFLGDGGARLYAQMFDNIRRSGAPLRVVWGGGQIIDDTGVMVGGDQFLRKGVLVKFKASFDRPQDCAWEMTFEWASQGEVVAPPIMATGIENPREGLFRVVEAMQLMASKINAFVDAPYSRVVNFTQNLRDNIDVAGNALLVMADTMQAASGAVNELTDIPAFIAERGIAVTMRSAYELRKLDAALFGDEDEDFEAPLDYEVVDSARGLLVFQLARYGLAQQSLITQELALDTASSLNGLLFPALLAEVRPPAGTDLRDLAQEYYGDPDLWWLIAQENGLTSSEVPSPPDGPSDNPFGVNAIRIPARRTGAFGELRRSC